jgi:Ni,Fe-hydrogenase I small subunit|tara:strand:- start:5580 stop:5807 length:228 start_codon:yes stop_codon:yes gene_type:complete
MGSSKLENAQKWKYTLLTTVIFILIANPYTYMLVDKLLGSFIKIANIKGCPTSAGFVVHTIVFTLILRYIMDLRI